MTQVSIIMPSYNRAWIINRAIDSVLRQTFADFELIIIDDASSDETAKVVKSYTDSRIKYLNHDNNRGSAAARNTGIKASESAFIAYLDSDNLWYPNYLEVMTSELQEEVVMVYSGQNLLLADGAKDDFHIIGRRVRNPKYNPAKLLQGNYIDINAVIHRRNVLDDLGLLDESIVGLEDWDLFVRIALHYPFQIKHIDQVLSEYYFFTKSTAKTHSNTMWSEWVINYFGLGEKEPNEAKVLAKIKATQKAAKLSSAR